MQWIGARTIATAALVAAAGAGQAAVDANTASLADLEAVAGLGPATAAAIVEARRERPFAGWSDLIARVRGVGPGTASALSKAGLTVGGHAAPARRAASPASAASRPR